MNIPGLSLDTATGNIVHTATNLSIVNLYRFHDLVDVAAQHLTAVDWDRPVEELRRDDAARYAMHAAQSTVSWTIDRYWNRVEDLVMARCDEQDVCRWCGEPDTDGAEDPDGEPHDVLTCSARRHVVPVDEIADKLAMVLPSILDYVEPQPAPKPATSTVTA